MILTLIVYVISPTGNCSKHGMSFTEFISKCLPATARKVSPDNTYLGFSPQVINVQTWQLDLSDNVTLRTALTLGTSPVFPIVRQILDTVTGSPLSLIIFTDTVTRVDPSQFIIPPSCSTS
ncbi:hypothetical protein Btru_064297 [Bulinus truncatus]|nr:hypothetical protein Btru_064297 [Bulinus truncatus]